MDGRIKRFLARIEDHTGVVRRYSKSLEAKNEPPWRMDHKEWIV